MNDSPTTLDRQWFLLGTTLLALLLTALVAWKYEAGFYRGLSGIEIAAAPLSSRDELLVFWVTWSKSLLVVLPLLVACGGLRWIGWRRTAWTLFGLGMTAVVYWLIVDLMIQRSTGNHVLAYWRAALNADTWEWVGQENVRGIQKRLTIMLVLVAAAVLGAVALARMVGRRTAPRVGPRWTRAACLAALAVYAFCLLGVVPAQSFVTPHGRPVLDALRLYLPVSALSLRRPEAQAVASLSRRVGEQYQRLRPSLYVARPVDESPLAPADNRPHVLILVLESLRHNIIAPATMPRLHAWANTGLRLEKHYAGANCSHYGLFALLYGRSPLVYDSCLDAKIPPQMCHSFRQAGYETWFITSGECGTFFRMGEYLNERTFDHVVDYNQGDWPTRDRQIFGRVRKVLEESKGRPQFIVAFMMSTHHPYQFPAEYARFKPFAPNLDILSSDLRESRTQILNRYQNAAAFSDDLVSDLIAELDPQKHLVIVTGDHGESIFEDGSLTHGSKLSEIQTRIPLVMGGAGVKPQVVRTATTHADLLPTMLHVLRGAETPIQHCHGRSALAPDRDGSVLLVQGFLDESTSRDWDRVLYIDHPWRTLFALQRSAPVVRFQGFVDEAARLRFDAAPDEAAVERLATGLGEKLQAVAETP